jgi:hypothetical protein
VAHGMIQLSASVITSNIDRFNKQLTGGQKILFENTRQIKTQFFTSWVFNTLKPRGSYMDHLLYQSMMLHFVFVGSV